MSELVDLLKAAAITRVIWVDDVFSEPPEETLIIAIQAKLRVLYENGQSPFHNAFKNVNVNAPEGIRDKQIENVLDSQSDNLPRILESLTRQINNCGLKGDPTQDLTPAQVIGLRDGLKISDTYPYRQWISRRSEILSKADERTLFLIDREFAKEGLADDLGDEILAEITAEAPKAYCIMFTHKVAANSADSLRIEIGNKISSVEPYQFGVMSKQGLGFGISDVSPHFSRALRMSLLCRFCCDVALQICDVMNNAARNSAKEMTSFSIETIDEAIFENSLIEGASELDVIIRILAVNQRIASQRALAKEPDSFDRLHRIRDVRAFKPSGLLETKLTTQPKLHLWRVAEVFDDEYYVNTIHSPLRCGDIFHNSENDYRYLLLAQPCDLTVRGGGSDIGKRRRDEAEFVIIEERGPEEKKRESNFVIAGVGEHGESWLINFSKAFSVNLKVLDLAVYNPEGHVFWELGQKAPVQLLPGWLKRFNDMEELIGDGSDPDALGELSHCDQDHQLCSSFIRGNYKFPLKRIGHIRSPYAEAIQASYAAFISRAALSHDFARNLWVDESKEE